MTAAEEGEGKYIVGLAGLRVSIQGPAMSHPYVPILRRTRTLCKNTKTPTSSGIISSGTSHI